MDEGHFLYVLRSEQANRFYVGVSANPRLRLKRHNTTSTGFTARYRPWSLVYQHFFPTKQEALAAERKAKAWKSKRMIQRLIAGEISPW